jgi:hypothetical protein
MSFYEARSELPTERYRLLKIQAEKNFREVMVVGLAIWIPVSIWFSLTDSGVAATDRHILTVALVPGFLACRS